MSIQRNVHNTRRQLREENFKLLFKHLAENKGEATERTLVGLDAGAWRTPLGQRFLHDVLNRAVGSRAPFKPWEPRFLWLMQAGADVNAPSEQGGTLYHTAARNGLSLDWPRGLKQLGAGSRRRDLEGNTPLHVLVCATLRADGNTPIDWAALLDAYAESPADFQARNRDGLTPLMKRMQVSMPLDDGQTLALLQRTPHRTAQVLARIEASDVPHTRAWLSAQRLHAQMETVAAPRRRRF